MRVHVKLIATFRDHLLPGADRIISVIAEDPFDTTPARATTRLCTQVGLGGYCYERTVDFTIG